GHEFTAQHGYGLATQVDAITAQAYTHYPTTWRGLVTHHLGLAQLLGPIGRQGTMCPAAHGIFIDANTRREEAGHEIEAMRDGRTGGSETIDPHHRRQIRFERAQFLFRG